MDQTYFDKSQTLLDYHFFSVLCVLYFFLLIPSLPLLYFTFQAMPIPNAAPHSFNEIVQEEMSSHNKVSSIIFEDVLTSRMVDDPSESFLGVSYYYKYSLSSFSNPLD